LRNAALATTIASITLLVAISASVLAGVESGNFASILKNNLASAREQLPDVFAAFSNISSRTRVQLATAEISSDNFLQWLGSNIYRGLCPLFNDCPQEFEIAATAPAPQRSLANTQPAQRHHKKSQPHHRSRERKQRLNQRRSSINQ